MATSSTDENLEKKQHLAASPPLPETTEASPQLHSGILLTTTGDKHDSDLSIELDNNPKSTPHSITQVRQLFVGNLPFRVRWQDLKDLFRKAGKVVRADVALSFDNRSKGHGTVLFTTIEDAQAAIDMLHNCKWQGRTLEVREDRGYYEQPFMKKSSSSSSASTSSLPTARKVPQPQQMSQQTPLQNHQKRTPSRNRDDQQQSFAKLGSTRHDAIQPGRQLFVGNLPFHCQWQDVKDLFRGAGKILRADVAQEPGGKSRGFGTVLYTTFEDAENAIAMFDGYEYQGRQLRVHFDKFASGQSHHHHHYHDRLHQHRQVHDYQLQQQPSRFGNLEFGQVTDPGVLENLKQTYGGISTGGYAAFMMGQSPYLSTSTETAYSPLSDDAISRNQNGYGMEPISSGFSTTSQQQQQQQSIYSHHCSNYSVTSPYFGYYSTSAPMIPSHSNSNGSYDQDTTNQQKVTPFGVDDLVESDMASKQSSSGFFVYDQNPSFMSSSPHQWTRSPQEKQELQQQNQQFNMYLSSFQQQSLNMNQQDELYDFYSYRHKEQQLQQNDNSGVRGNDRNSTSTTGNLNEGMQKMGLSDNNRNGSAGLANGFGMNGQQHSNNNNNNNNNAGGSGAWDPLSGLKI